MVEKGSKKIKLYSKTALDYIYIVASFPVLGKIKNKKKIHVIHYKFCTKLKNWMFDKHSFFPFAQLTNYESIRALYIHIRFIFLPFPVSINQSSLNTERNTILTAIT